MQPSYPGEKSEKRLSGKKKGAEARTRRGKEEEMEENQSSSP